MGHRPSRDVNLAPCLLEWNFWEPALGPLGSDVLLGCQSLIWCWVQVRAYFFGQGPMSAIESTWSSVFGSYSRIVFVLSKGSPFTLVAPVRFSLAV